MRAESRAREIRTGIFVIVALVILVALTLWVAGSSVLGGKKKAYQVLMPDAGGVRPGDQVRLAGVPVGRVESVDLRDDPEWPVAIEVELDEGVNLTEQARAQFASDGLLGSSFLSLDPGPLGTRLLGKDKPILGAKAAGISVALRRVDEVVEKTVILLDETTLLVRGLPERLDPLLARLNEVLSEENVEQLNATLSLLHRTLEETGPRIPDLLTRLESTLDELDKGIRSVPELTGEAQALVGELRTALGPDGHRLRDVLEAADGTLTGASEALGVVSGSSGDLEAAIRDLRAATSNLRMLSRELRERPDRLILPHRKPDRRPGDGGGP